MGLSACHVSTFALFAVPVICRCPFWSPGAAGKSKGHFCVPFQVSAAAAKRTRASRKRTRISASLQKNTQTRDVSRTAKSAGHRNNATFFSHSPNEFLSACVISVSETAYVWVLPKAPGEVAYFTVNDIDQISDDSCQKLRVEM